MTLFSKTLLNIICGSTRARNCRSVPFTRLRDKLPGSYLNSALGESAIIDLVVFVRHIVLVLEVFNIFKLVSHSLTKKRGVRVRRPIAVPILGTMHRAMTVVPRVGTKLCQLIERTQKLDVRKERAVTTPSSPTVQRVCRTFNNFRHTHRHRHGNRIRCRRITYSYQSHIANYTGAERFGDPYATSDLGKDNISVVRNRPSDFGLVRTANLVDSVRDLVERSCGVRVVSSKESAIRKKSSFLHPL